MRFQKDPDTWWTGPKSSSSPVKSAILSSDNGLKQW